MRRTRGGAGAFSWVFKSLAAIAAAACFAACATSPTGRKQAMVVDDAQMASLGQQSFEQIKQQTPIERDPKINEFVRCVAVPITKQVPGVVPNDQWEIVVFKDKTANAFALPGGKIGVNTGMLPVAKTDAQLAAVLGHEIGHVLAKHSAERMSENVLAEGGLSILGGVLGGNPNQGTIMGALGVGAQYGLLLPHSRDQESEADVIGLDLMAKAGFDPRQSVELWKNMMSSSSGAPPEFLSTHPSNQSRIDGLEAKMGAAVPTYEQARAAGQKPSCPHP